MSFRKDLQIFYHGSAEAAERTARAIKIELFSSTIADTPVLSGRARGNWQTTEGQPAIGTIERLDKSGARARKEVMDKVTPGDGTSILTNNLPYIAQLEYGSSQKAPEGMMRKNVARIERIVQQAARKHRRK